MLTLLPVSEERNPTPDGMELLRFSLKYSGLIPMVDRELGTGALLVADGWAEPSGTDYCLRITEAGRRALAEAQREIEASRECAA